jgi:guanylate kinase
MKSGRLIVITGPSGVGKGTLVKSLIWSHPKLYLSISATTRSPRSHEQEGQHYYFVDQATFEQMIEEKKFLEWAKYTDNYYGTPRTPVESRLEQGQNVLLEIEVIGARKIKENFPDSLTIFILPPSLEELERRLLERGTETQEVIARRLEKAQQEILASAEFDYSICNDDLEITIEDLERIIFS